MFKLQRSCASVEKVHNILHLIWKTIHFSAKRTRELKAVADTMGVSTLKPPYSNPGQYAAVLQHMEHLASTSQNADIKGQAKNKAAGMKETHFVAFCHFLADFLSYLGNN